MVTQPTEIGASNKEFDINQMPLPERSIFHKAEKVLSWLNEPAEHKYTLGELFRKVTFQEPSQHGFHASRIGRIAERVATIGLTIAVLTMGPANIAVIPMLIGAKVAGVGFGGLVAMPLSKGLEGIMRHIDRATDKSNKVNTDEFARKRGIKPNEQAVGARNAKDYNPEEKIGASRIVNPDATIKQEFGTVAADTRAADARAFDPTGAKPIETYGLGQKKAAAGGPGQKNGA